MGDDNSEGHKHLIKPDMLTFACLLDLFERLEQLIGVFKNMPLVEPGLEMPQILLLLRVSALSIIVIQLLHRVMLGIRMTRPPRRSESLYLFVLSRATVSSLSPSSGGTVHRLCSWVFEKLADDVGE